MGRVGVLRLSVFGTDTEDIQILCDVVLAGICAGWKTGLVGYGDGTFAFNGTLM